MSYLHRIYDTINIKDSKVGLGTTSPSELLHVEGAMFVNRITNNSSVLNFSGLSLSNIQDITANGTLTASNLNILGDFTVLNTTTSNTEQMVITNLGSGPALKVIQTGAGSQFSVAEFYDNETGIAMKIADTGLIGIGTSSPSSRMHMYDTANLYSTIETTNSNAAQVKLINAGGTTLIGPSTDNTVRFTTTADEPIIFGTSNTARVTIANDGKFGIGTTTPLYSLDVRGTAISLAAPVYMKNGNMNLIHTSIGNQEYTTNGSHTLGIRAQWTTTTTDNKLAFRVSAKFHIASDTSSAFRRFESIVTPKNDAANNRPCELVVVGSGETSSTEFTSFTNTVTRNGVNSVDINVGWSASAQPAIGNLELQIFANTSLGDFAFTPISS